MVAEANPMIQKAWGVLAELSADEKMRIDAAAREKALKDYNSFMYEATRTGLAKGLAEGLAKGEAEGLAKGEAKGLAKGEAKGLAEGLAKGKAEGLAETARKMKEEGFSPEQIQRITGLLRE
ncbi:hypothetical protein FACS1894142_4510 [Spirochaetia bacterium]|nr:hypothetical protein FACS1894142_4510 [Spirochaetia bacterium]